MKKKKIKFGIIGCGVVGNRRARALPVGSLIYAADKDINCAKAISDAFNGSKFTDRWEDVVFDPEVDAVIIATTHDSLASITSAALESGKHVLVEKPAARNPDELKPVIDLANKNNLVVRVGFNHRFHPGIMKARQIIDSGELGDLLFIRAKYGHGGRIGYENEWRAKKEISGGGELIDQGMHLIDLSRFFLGDFEHVDGRLKTFYWDMMVEDNAFITLETATGQVAWLQAGWTEWKNIFCFEIFGRKGKLQIDGLGGSYGTEKLTFYKLLPQMGPPETISWEFPFPDSSWDLELQDFTLAISEGGSPNGNIHDAMAALRICEKIYNGNK